MKNESFVSIIIPCRNEEKFIGRCLGSVIANNYPNDKLEVLVIDGMSEDVTRKIVRKYAEKYPFVKLLENPNKIVPTALNIGIKNAQGEIIIRMDAHNVYEKDYIPKCVKYLKKYDVDNVGGVLVTLPAGDNVLSRSIALALSHPFGVGNSYFRIGTKEPRYVDTVPFGCYKKEVFEKIGLFDEDLIRNQDDEFNLRLIKSGGKILLVPEIVSYYYARDSLAKLWKMYFQYGYFKPLVVRKVGGVLTWRQTIPSLFVGSLLTMGLLSFLNGYFLLLFLFVAGFYAVVNFYFSLNISIKNKNLFLVPFLIISFGILHFSYGLGYLKGILDFIVSGKHLKKKIKDMPNTR
ncbi:MAG: glycosyltransferase family 2 protein [Elusimicrobiota bacterium]